MGVQGAANPLPQKSHYFQNNLTFLVPKIVRLFMHVKVTALQSCPVFWLIIYVVDVNISETKRDRVVNKGEHETDRRSFVVVVGIT